MVKISNFLPAIGASSANQSNPTANTRPIDLHATSSWHYNGWNPTIRMHFHPIILHSEFAVVQSNVLYVWLFVLGILDSCHHMLGDDHPPMLFPSVCWRLSLVVAVILNIRLHRILSIHLLLPLFCYQIVHRRFSFDIFVLWLHFDYGLSIFLNDRHHWFHGMLLVYPKDLQRGQSRLSSTWESANLFFLEFSYSIAISFQHDKNELMKCFKWTKLWLGHV